MDGYSKNSTAVVPSEMLPPLVELTMTVQVIEYGPDDVTVTLITSGGDAEVSGIPVGLSVPQSNVVMVDLLPVTVGIGVGVISGVGVDVGRGVPGVPDSVGASVGRGAKVSAVGASLGPRKVKYSFSPPL